MSNSRKTQGDIDKLNKKINEGIEEYEGIYDKFAEAPNAALKERFEGDLKKEIKKLQRLREQVKTLIQSPDVKDKKALEVSRRRVEEKMEAFKVVERETKTKAFSKEGLANLSSNNSETPQQRTEMWIKTSISELKEQIETCEFELHAATEAGGAASSGKRRGGKKKDSEDPKEIRLLRLKINTLKLEQLLRLVVNEDLQPDEVDEIEEDVQRFIDENMEEDFEEDEELYERFDLPDVPVRRGTDSDAEEEDQKKPAAPTPTTGAAAVPAAANAPGASASATAAKKEVALKPVKGPDTPPASATAAAAAVAKTPMTPATAQKTVVPAPASKKNETAAPAAVPVATSTNPTTPATPFGKKTVAAVVAAAAAPSAPAPTKTAAAAPSVAAPKTAGPASFAAAAAAGVVKSSSSSSTNAAQFPALAPAAPTGGIMGSGFAAADELLEEEGAYVDDDAIDGANDDTFGDDAMPVSSTTGSLADMANTTNRMESDWDRLRKQQQPQSSIVAPRAVSVGDAGEAVMGPPMAPQPAAQSPQQHASQPAPAGSQVWSALLKAQQPSEEKVAVHRMLDMSLTNLPHPHDVERVRPFVPPNPYQTKPHHPQSVHPGFSSPDMFRKFDPDTLFFIFYYQQQTYQQYLAAKELKRQSFRYHKKFKTWFQRHDKPKESTEEYESGAYLYFDYENGWCQRIKNDFVFKYAYLEDELV